LQPSLDEIAIQAAEQLTGTLATEVQMCEIVHAAQSSTAALVSL